jgi:hypothetical protein
MQGHLAVWKEALLDPDEPHRATMEYLWRAHWGLATRYD